jgi:hypothetical protein
MSVCLLYVFAALLEYAVVNVLARKRGARVLHSIPRPQNFRLPFAALKQCRSLSPIAVSEHAGGPMPSGQGYGTGSLRDQVVILLTIVPSSVGLTGRPAVRVAGTLYPSRISI